MIARRVPVLILAASFVIVGCGSSKAVSAEEEVPKIVDGVYHSVNGKMPELIGSLQDIQNNISLPEELKDSDLSGRVFLRFVVDAAGDVTDVEVARGLHPQIDEACVEAIRQARFIPGEHEGNPVPVLVALPITIRM